MVFSRRFFKHLAYSLALVGLLLVLYPLYVETHKAEAIKQSALSLLLAGEESTAHLHDRTQESDCTVHGALPDNDCTPGAIFEDATKEKICVQGYSKTVRSVSTSLRKKVFVEYNISYPQPYGSYEVDHVIPLALAGSNDIANLFPEAQKPYPGFKEKDVVENYLHEEVCSGRVALTIAQHQIANEWVMIYNNLDPNIIRDFKNKYKSWAPTNPDTE